MEFIFATVARESVCQKRKKREESSGVDMEQTGRTTDTAYRVAVMLFNMAECSSRRS